MTEKRVGSPSFWRRRLGTASVICLGAILSALPAIPLRDPLATFHLSLDDFNYVAESRNPSRTIEYLLTPHNSHVVPLFRLTTLGLIKISGRLDNLPIAFAVASYVTLALSMLCVGHLVAWETRSIARGFAIMACFGLSTVIEPTVIWYSAGQALLAGLCVGGSLAAWQHYRVKPSRFRLWLAIPPTIAAPWFWSGGFIAGPAGFLYLRADARPELRKAAILPVLLLGFSLAFAGATAGSRMLAASNFHERSVTSAANPLRGAFHTAQGVVEALVLNNLGLEAQTSPVPAAILCAIGLVSLCGLRSGRISLSPLERAGLAIVVMGFGLPYTFRGYLSFESLRDISWYHAIPQMGALLILGVRFPSRPEGPPGRPSLPTRSEACAVLLVALLVMLVHRPRAVAVFERTTPPLSASERSRFPTESLRLERARAVASEHRDRQRRFLSRLGETERIGKERGIGRESIRAAFGVVLGPGMVESLKDFDASNLLDLPDRDSLDARDLATARAREALSGIYYAEPEFRPPWLDGAEPWPPRRGTH